MILAGVVASSAGGFAATGGNLVFEANGYRHHYFTSSGTFTVSSGVAPVTMIMQGGGGNGQGGEGSSYSYARAGRGGFGGRISYSTGTVSSNLTVTIGAGNDGETKAVGTGITATSLNGNRINEGNSAAGAAWTVVQYCVNFCCDPWGCYCCGDAYGWVKNSNESQGNPGLLHSSYSSIYGGTFTSFAPASSGGAGGYGAFSSGSSGYSNPITVALESGKQNGGGSGGTAELPSYSPGAGGNATSATGGGGGGGGAIAAGWGQAFWNMGGNGGSGYAIISYPL
jgi:hypothetical protein